MSINTIETPQALGSIGCLYPRTQDKKQPSLVRQHRGQLSMLTSVSTVTGT